MTTGTMHHYIITGTSRGIGHALARKLLGEGNALYCVSRKRNEELVRDAASKGAMLRYYEFDLNDTGGIGGLLDRVFGDMDLAAAASITLVNNAGILGPVRPLHRCEPAELAENLRVNLAAPMVLASAFMRRTSRSSAPRRIMNLTSGAGKNPYYGWGAYGAAKAGINLLTRCASLEQSGERNPARVLAFSPGPVDTDMQVLIRSARPEDFPDRQKFIDYQEHGGLLSPERAAEAILYVLREERFTSGSIVSIRDLPGIYREI